MEVESKSAYDANRDHFDRVFTGTAILEILLRVKS